jgi:hypothetical protein
MLFSRRNGGFPGRLFLTPRPQTQYHLSVRRLVLVVGADLRVRPGLIASPGKRRQGRLPLQMANALVPRWRFFRPAARIYSRPPREYNCVIVRGGRISKPAFPERFA